MKVTLVAHTPRPLYVIAEAASVCYDSEPSLKIVKGCIRSGHTSVLEHATFTFRIEGVSRACSHQLVRHRIASYSQQSQRYVTYNGDIQWVTDSIYYDARRQVLECCENAIDTYTNLIEDGVAAEDARSVLPNATPTILYMTMNLRSLMNFCNERMCTRAQKEIRKVANAMKKAILTAETISQEEKDIIDPVLVPKCEKYPVHFCPEVNGCGKHHPLKDFVYKGDIE